MKKRENGESRTIGSFIIRTLSSDIIRQIKSRRMWWAGHLTSMGEGRDVYRVLEEKPEGKSPLERPRRRWEYEIKMDLREIGWWRGVLSRYTWLSIGNADGSCECGDEPSDSGATELVATAKVIKSNAVLGFSSTVRK
jgi:hypothetical protein